MEHFYQDAAGFTFQVDRRIQITVNGQAAFQAAVGAILQRHTLLHVPAPRALLGRGEEPIRQDRLPARRILAEGLHVPVPDSGERSDVKLPVEPK